MTLLLRIAGIFFKIGLLTVGGGLAMVPIVQHEMIAHGWLDNQQFLDILGIAQMTPGPLSINTATFVGYRIIRSLDPPGSFLYACLAALIATLAVSAPSLLFINALGPFWERNRESPCAVKIFTFLRPIVTGLVASASLVLAANSLWGDELGEILTRSPDLCGAVILVGVFICSAFTGISPFFQLVGGIVLGLLMM